SRRIVTAIDASVLLPLVSPPFTAAIAMIFSFGPRGLVSYSVFGVKGFSVYGVGATLFSEALTYFPIAYLTLRPILAGIDSNIETMAQSLGASRARVFRTVTLPLCVPGIANAFLLLFAASLADFATSLIVALGANHALTLQHYRVIFTEGWKAIRDTLIIAGVSMPLGGLYGIVLGYLVTRQRFWGRRTMEAVSMMNYALPGTIVGIAYLIAFNDPPFVLTGTAL